MRMECLAAALLAHCLLLAPAVVHGQPAPAVVSPETMTPTLSGHELAGLMAAREKLLVLDVRELAEFAVSHLRSAARVEPGVTTESFLVTHGSAARGAVVVLYCTTGGRSIDLANRVDDLLMAAGARAVYVLKGGIFAWHDERRPLFNAKGRTSHVHPHDSETAKLLKRPKLARMTPLN